MNINQRRKKIILKGYANISDVMKFCAVGRKKAKQIFEEITEEIEAEGKKVNELGIPAKRLAEYLGFSEAKIFKFAEEEK